MKKGKKLLSAMLSLAMISSALGCFCVSFPKTALAASNVKEQNVKEQKLNSNYEKFKGDKITGEKSGTEKLAAGDDEDKIWDYQLTPNSRLSGNDRYGTAADIVSKGRSMFSDYAIIATGENYADALCAAPLSKKYNAPILFTNTASLNDNAKKELIDCNIKNVMIVGGTGAVSQNTENQIKALGITTSRIAGVNRYDTSVKIAQKLGSIKKIVVATGNDYPDALSIATIAAIEGMPILLTEKDSIPSDTMTYINNNKNVTVTYVVGGTGVISENVKSKLAKPVRLAGANRYETNVKILSNFRSDLDMAQVFLATGQNFPDALACSALSPFIKSPIVLTDLTAGKETVSYINSNITSIGQVVAIGGTGVIPDTLLNNAQKNFNVPYSNPEIKFSDISVEKDVRTRLNQATGTLHQRDINKIISLTPHGIKDISDIEKLGNLLCLCFGNTELSDISKIKNLINLEYLYLGQNEITNISALSNLVNLTKLSLARNNISNISPLKALNKLQYLDLSINNISNISDLSGLNNLQELDLSYNNVSDISALKNCINLRSITFWDNHVKNIGALANCTNMQYIQFSGNNVTDISILKSMTNLNKIDFSYNNGIENINALKGLTTLENINLCDNHISDISAISSLTNLKTLDLDQNNVSNISALKDMTKLYSISLSDNLISDLLPLAGLINLKYLSLNYNDKITSISALAGNINLISLDCFSCNQLKDISAVKNMTKLTGLTLTDTLINDISTLSSLTQLKDLNISYNNISNITPLSSLTQLNDLNISYNNISNISTLSSLTQLNKLNISGNKISNITPLLGLSALRTLDIWSNNISAADQTKLKNALPNCTIRFTNPNPGLVKKSK